MAAAAGGMQAAGASETVAAAPGTGCEPRISGSFFDLIHVNPFDAAYWSEPCRFWGEDNWRALMRDMHGIGIDTVICVSTAFWGRPMFAGYEKKVGIPMKFGCEDPLAVCVDEVEKLGMKIFLGFGFRGRCSQVRDYAGMEPPWPEVWFRWNTAMAEVLMERFASRPCFAGLYVSYEADFREHEVNLYEKLVKEYLRPACGSVKLLASPGNLGDHPNLAAFPKQVERTGLNILAPQDYGGRTSNVEDALNLVRKNARALEQVRKPLQDLGVALWSNCETFNKEPTPDGRAATIAGPIERITQQIALQAPLVEKLICYQYQGIMNRHTELVNIGHPSTNELYRGYAAYLNERFPGRFGV